MSRFLLFQVVPHTIHQDQALRDMEEVELLVDTYGGEVIEKSAQHRDHPDAGLYIGSGRLDWLKATVKEKKIDVVVLNAIVNSGQLFRLEQQLWEVNTKIAVWDRVDLILNIFEKHASTKEAKLQIELARLEHLGPRIYGLGGTVLSRQGGGIGTRGSGETNIEQERQTMKKLRQKIEQQLASYSKEQERRMNERRLSGTHTVALVGYTSAGKSTLFNALTNKQRRTDASLFTTLDSVVGKLKISPFAPDVLLSDTIGFIQDLPPVLIQAFHSTLVESLGAQLIFHVVDSADERYIEKLETVESILQDLGVSVAPVLIFNKIDRINSERREKILAQYKDRAIFFISATTSEGLDELKKYLRDEFVIPDVVNS